MCKVSVSPLALKMNDIFSFYLTWVSSHILDFYMTVLHSAGSLKTWEHFRHKVLTAVFC